MPMMLSSVQTRRGNRLSVAVVGPRVHEADATPVLLIHPINMRKECWWGILPALAAQRPCVLVDLAGHGESSDDDFALGHWVDDAVDVLDELDLAAVHLVGGSLGGAIGLGVAAARPERVHSVTGFGSTVDPTPADRRSLPALASDEDVEALFQELARQALAPGASAEQVETVCRLTNQHGADVVTRILQAAFRADATAWLDVHCPALWVAGEHDSSCTPTENARIARSLHGTAVELPGVGHLAMIEDSETSLAHLTSHLDAADDVASGVPSPWP